MSRSSTLATCSVAVPTDPSAGTATADRNRLPGVDVQADAEVTLAEVARGAERMVDVDGRRLQIKIPPGVREGARIKLRGAGLKERAGAPSGDLYVTVHVRPDPRFERDGANLRTEVPITLLEAIAGAEVPIQTPTGTLKLRIRPNTQNGQEIHVAGKGLPKPGRDGGRGDLIVRVRVELPHLDDETRDEMADAARQASAAGSPGQAKESLTCVSSGSRSAPRRPSPRLSSSPRQRAIPSSTCCT